MRRARGRTRRAGFPRRRTFSAPAGAKGAGVRGSIGMYGGVHGGRTRRACFLLRRRSAGPPPLLWPYPYHLFPRIVRPLCRFQRYSCPARPNPARRRPRHPHSLIPPCRGFCPSAAGRADIGRDTAPARVLRAAYPCAPRVLPAASFCLRSAGKADIGSEPARTVPAASPCARPPASSAQPYPSVPRVLSVRRGKGGYWQGASACRARRVTLRARPHPLRSPIPACRRFFPALRRPRPLCGLTLRAPAFPVRPIPARRPPPPARRPAASARCHRAAARPPRWPRRASGPPRPRAIYRAWTWPRAGPSTA